MIAIHSGFGAVARRLMAPPYLGLFVFGTILLYKPIAHTLLVLQHVIFPGDTKYIAGALVGLLGFWLVGKGLRRNELAATAMGFMGGALIWMGWFEHTFEFFAEALGVDPVMGDGKMQLPPNLALMEVTIVPFIAMLALFGANRETRCRLLMWFHRTFKMSPQKPTTGYRRNYAWVTAWEAIFITWAFYLMIVVIYDPRVAGKDSVAAYVAFGTFLVWGVYLLARLIKYAEPAAAIRYAIPTTNAFWITIEMGSHWKWFEEIWVKPLQYPGSAVTFVAVFAVCAFMILQRGGALDVAGPQAAE